MIVGQKEYSINIMSNKDLLTQLVSKLEEYLKKLEFLQKYNKEEFLENWQIEVQVDRMMQLIIECSIDIGEEILSGIKVRAPKTYKETFLLLRQNKVIDDYLMKKLQDLCDFRNELVHDYLFLGPEKIYDKFVITSEIIEEYLGKIKSFISKK